MFRFRRTAIAAIALALLLGGCGGDDGGDDAADATVEDTSTTAAPTDDSDSDDADDSDDTDADDQTADDSDSDDSAAGAVPDACTLVEAAEVEAVVPGAEHEDEDGTAIDGLAFSQCEWENDETLLIVAVVEGSSRFEMHQSNLPGEPVTGVGESALVAPGVSSETRGATGGRTVSALVDGNTLVVALRLDGQTTNEDVVPLATTIAGRLAG